MSLPRSIAIAERRAGGSALSLRLGRPFEWPLTLRRAPLMIYASAPRTVFRTMSSADLRSNRSFERMPGWSPSSPRGSCFYALVRAGSEHVGGIETAPVPAEFRFRVWTPAQFRHHGLHYLLPDPYITFASPARRYRTYRPEAHLDDDLIRELGRTVMVVGRRIRTELFSWHDRTDSGFLGVFSVRLSAEATTRARRAFGTLGAFAGIAGLGRGATAVTAAGFTTHGLGATDVTMVSAATRRSGQVGDPE